MRLSIIFAACIIAKLNITPEVFLMIMVIACFGDLVDFIKGGK